MCLSPGWVMFPWNGEESLSSANGAPLGKTSACGSALCLPMHPPRRDLFLTGCLLLHVSIELGTPPFALKSAEQSQNLWAPWKCQLTKYVNILCKCLQTFSSNVMRGGEYGSSNEDSRVFS